LNVTQDNSNASAPHLRHYFHSIGTAHLTKAKSPRATALIKKPVYGLSFRAREVVRSSDWLNVLPAIPMARSLPTWRFAEVT
jgi:hypothetical protein